MKKTFFKITTMLIMLVFVSCSKPTGKSNVTNDSIETTNIKEANDVLPDIVGYYRLPETGCDLALTIIKQNDKLKYYFKGEHIDIEGIAILSKENDDFYITFDGPIGGYPAKTVTGQYTNNSIIIQNYGNSMNNYTYFPDCDEKYLEFAKQN